MMRKTTPFEGVTDFEFISTIGISSFVFAVRPDHPAKTFLELIEISKKEPGSQTYTSIGRGSTHNLIGELTQRTYGVKWVEVPYKGGQAALTDVLSGQVSIGLDAAGSAMNFITSGQLRPLAVTMKPRMPQLPDVPAVSEFPPGTDTGSYYGLAAPAKTPPAIINRLNAAVVAAVADPEVQKTLRNIGSTPQSSTPAEFTARVKGDVDRWTKLIIELDL
jgi:tripartite-type tricarboxylate transporter receptor subunit TctC